jgi:hypothetical protein
MFVQVIEGKASSPEAVRAAGEAWNADVRPVAEGFLGSTEGVAADGTAIIVARFADKAAADANNERPEQQAWFEANQSMFEGEPTFAESEDVEQVLDGGSDDAGFVQIMQGTCTDRDKASAFEKEFEPRLREVRPDLLGGLRVWHDGGRFTDVNYFTSEAEARSNEATMGEQMPEGMEAFTETFQVDRWLDLTPPNLHFQ